MTWRMHGELHGRGRFEPCKGLNVPLVAGSFFDHLSPWLKRRRMPMETILVLREWSCRFEAYSVVISHRGGTAGSFLKVRRFGGNCSGECRTELQPPKLDGLAGSTPPGHTLSGTSGAIRFRPSSSPLQVPAKWERTIPANAGRTTGRAARRIFAGQVGCSIHPVLPQEARSSVNCPAKSRRRDNEEGLGECRR
jgi:hypothetical protein